MMLSLSSVKCRIVEMGMGIDDRLLPLPRSLHGYAFGQISRPVRIVSACQGGEISEKLTGNCLHDGWQAPHWVSDKFFKDVSCGLPTPMMYPPRLLSSAAPESTSVLVSSSGANIRQGVPGFDQGDDAVLQLAGGEPLGMNVADLFDFQGRLEGRKEVADRGR